MLRKLLTAVTFCLFTTGAFSQAAQANWWYFGSNAGMQFTAGPPAVTLGGMVNTVEGSATISDAAGQLRFYTDGMTVWNRNHVAMPNGTGLMGNSSSTQSGVIVQRPGNANLYYVFTCDAQAGPNGLRWSEVDMTQAAGFGAVTANKNILLYTPTTERICAIRHCNNVDVWVVTHHWGTNQFRAFLVTAAGINAVPVTSNLGSVQTGSNAMTIGYLKVSPDGRKLAMASRYTSAGGQPGFVELFDFDNTTGLVTNNVTLGNFSYSYGVEFSPNSQLLYLNASQTGRIYQFNLCAGSNAAIIASSLQVGTSASGWIGGMQLGPDGKIYMARYLVQWLGVINSPNTLGAGCNYVDNGFSTAPRNSQLGIPNFMTNYLRTPPNIQTQLVANTNCLTVNFTYSVTIAGGCSPANTITGVNWNFGDPGSGPLNTSTQTNPQHVFSGTGTYTVTLITNYPCYADTAHATVSVIACGVTATLSSATICAGGCTNLQVTTTGGSGPFTYAWSPNIGNGPGPYNVCPTLTTVYTCTVTDATNSTSITTSTVTVNPPATVTPTSTPVVCNGGNTGSATVTPAGNGPFTYSWNSTPVQSTQTANNLPAGNYTVTVTDGNGCQSTGTVAVTQPTALAVSTSSTAPTCTACDGTASGTGSGGTGVLTYSWNTTPVQSTSTATSLCAGNYVLTVTDGNGCVATQNVTLTANIVPLQTTSTTVNASCNGVCDGSAIANALSGTAPYTYAWSNSTNTQTVSNLCPGSYTCTLTDANGCVGTQSVTVTQPTPIVLSTTFVDPICTACNGSADVTGTGGTGSYTYQWTTGGTGSTETNLCAGQVTVTVTDANGCQQTASVILAAQITPLVFSASSTDETCNGLCDGTATGTTPSNGTGPYTYQWSSGGTNPTESNLCAGNYNLVVTDVNGCTNTQPVTITQPTVLTMVTGSTGASCNGLCDGTASVTASNGTAPYTYSWSSGGTGTTESNLCAGAYNITVTDDNGCTLTQAVNVTQPPAMSLALASTDPNCTACNGSITVTPGGGSTPYSYAWSSGGSNPTESSLCAGNYTVTVTDANGCQQQTNTTLNANIIALTSTTAVTDATCFGDCNGSGTVTMTNGTAPYTYAWSNGGSSATESALCAATYNVTITDVDGCTGTANITVNQPAALAVIVGPGVTVCAGTPATISANASGGTGPYHYTWNPGTFNGSSVSVTPQTTTTYTLDVTDNNNCTTQQQTVTVTVNPLPAVQFSSDAQQGCAPLCVNFVNTTPGAQTSAWEFGDNTNSTSNSPQHCYTTPGTYDVGLTVTDGNGCTNSIIMNAYINVYPMPSAAFTFGPQPTDLFNPTIYFTDQSTGATSWLWSFGDFDNSSSTLQNPMFAYPDSGYFQVYQVVSNQYGCVDTTSEWVQINGIQTIYAPNAFTPNSDGNNDVFNVKGLNLDPANFELMIFDRWGNMIFRTDDLYGGWNGKANGGSQTAQIDVYVWKVHAVSLIDSRDIFMMGHVSLIK